MGLVPPDGRLPRAPARAGATGNGALLVFDEVITGFRVARGGAQELTGVTPDLVVMGKIIGGGLPAAAYGGPRALMERIAPAGDVYQAGTLSGNPLAVAAGLATLGPARRGRLPAPEPPRPSSSPPACARRRATRPVQVVTAPGLLTVFFSDEPVRDYEGAKRCDTEAFGAWCRGLLARGVYPPPAQFEAWFPSLAHTQDARRVHRRGGRRRRSRRSA